MNFGRLGRVFGRLGAQVKAATAAAPVTLPEGSFYQIIIG